VSETGQFRDRNMFGEDQHVEQVTCSTVRSLAVVTGIGVELLGQVLAHVDHRHRGSWHASEVEKASQLHDLDGPGVVGNEVDIKLEPLELATVEAGRRRCSGARRLGSQL